MLPLLGGCDELVDLLVSEATLEDLGRQTWARLTQEMPRSSDPGARALVARTTERLLVADGARDERWEVEVFALPEINAFVLPGRKIGVFEGMLEATEDEAELAAVLGHEIGHLRAEHAQERLSAELARQWGLQLIRLLLDIHDVEFAAEIAGALGVGLEFGLVRPYGRQQELEADRLGLRMMARAGYDPAEAIAFWTRMDRDGAHTLPAILSTHPAPRARIEALQEALAELEPMGQSGRALMPGGR